MTLEGDVVLVYMEGKPAFFARIEEITPDPKPAWFQVKMLVLQVPVMVITWILRQPYIDGEEFTMGGRPIRMEKVVAPEDRISSEASGPLPTRPSRESPDQPSKAPSEVPEKAKVVSLAERRKKNHSS